MPTDTRKVSLRGLRTFCVAAEHESFRAAADRLFITASAVSHQIKNLENELGHTLFSRINSRLRLTDTGRSFFIELAPIVDRLDDVTDQYRVHTGRPSLRVSISTFFASELFLPRFSEFIDSHPNIDLHIDTNDDHAVIHPRGANLSIRLLSSIPASVASDILFPLQLIPAGSPDFLGKLRVQDKGITSAFPAIVHHSRPMIWKQWARQSGMTLPRNAPGITVDSIAAAVRAAEHGLGAVLVPVPMGNAWFESGSLVPLFPDVFVTGEKYVLIHDNDGREDVGILRDWVLQNFEDRT